MTLQLGYTEPVRIEVIRWDTPDLVDVFAEQPVIATRGPEAKFLQSLGVTERQRNGFPGF